MSSTTIKTGLNDVSILMLALLFLLVVILNTGSTGYVRGGGGDGDDGSGIGGTGRQGILGGAGDGSESGFGGTGFKPFLGVTEKNGEVQIFDSRKIPEGISPIIGDSIARPSLIALKNEIEAPTVSNRQIVISSSSRGEVSIETAIQFDIDTKALFFASLSNAQLTGLLSTESGFSQADVVTTESSSDNQTPGWGVLSDYLVNTATVIPIDSVSENEIPALRQERGVHPERIQRPALPPMQRIRPIERVSVLPPRIQPMRI